MELTTAVAADAPGMFAAGAAAADDPAVLVAVACAVTVLRGGAYALANNSERVIHMIDPHDLWSA